MRIHSLLLISVMVSSQLNGATIAADTPSKANSYTDKKNGYEISFPADWKTKPDPIVQLVAAPRAIINKDLPLPNIKIVARSLPTGQTLDSICDTAKRQWRVAWKVESDEKATVGATPIRRLILTQDVGVLKTKILKVFAAASDKYYVLSCSDDPKTFEKSLPVFDKIVNSLVLAP